MLTIVEIGSNTRAKSVSVVGKRNFLKDGREWRGSVAHFGAGACGDGYPDLCWRFGPGFNSYAPPALMSNRKRMGEFCAMSVFRAYPCDRRERVAGKCVARMGE